MSTLVRRLLIAFALLGLVASASATYVHYRMLQEPGYLSFCDISATVSCTEVYKSAYATIAGVPVAIGGALWFVFILVLLLASARAKETFKENAAGYVFALSTIALGAVLYLGYASLFVLKTVCPNCVATYVAVIGIFLISGARTSFPMTSLPRRAARDLQALAASPVALLVAVLFVATAASALAFFPREEHAASAGEAAAAAPQATQDQRSEFERYYMNLPRVQVPVNGEGATVVIVKFHDFQCPACAKAYFEYRKIFAKYQAEKPGAVKLVEKDFPLEMECNSTMQSSMHAAACEAAVAVRLARQKGKGAEMEDWLFVNQEKMTPAMVRQGVRDVGGVTDFDDQYPKVIDQVKADIALARLLDVRATPTFFINGTKVDGGFPPQYFEQAIELELKKVAQAKP
jgi:uncharacterized membrane protein/protein-disulfide isomerase